MIQYTKIIKKLASDILDFKAEGFRKDEKTYVEITVKIEEQMNETNYTKTIDYVLKYW